MIINNWFKEGMMNKNSNNNNSKNNKWNSNNSGEDEINTSGVEQNEKLFNFTRKYSLSNNSDIDYGIKTNITNTTMNSSSTCQTQTINSSGSSGSCENTQKHLTPKQFLEKYSLPRVVKIIPQEPIADSCGNFDPVTLLSGQLLMYKHYNSGKVEARSFPNDRKDYSSLVVIPETYKGWFSVVTERGQIKARLYSSIQRLVSAQVTVFLTVSQDLPAYIQTNSDEISTQYTKTSVKSGQVLKLLAVYQDLNSNQSTKSKRLSWPLIGSKQHTSRYAQCLSSSNQVLFINLNTPGQFYAVSMTHNSTEENVTKVYQIQKLLRTFPLPVRVTIIGSNKNYGSMLLENYHKEHVVLSCVLDGADVTSNDSTSEKFRLLEIDVNSKFYVMKPGGRDVDERRLFYSPLVQRALKFCNDNSEQWISQLKIIHHIYPQNSNHILPNHQNIMIEKSKRNRKISIGDKITVKSASFRYSTSYGNEAPRPLIKKHDLEKPSKAKVYDFNYKQTHEFLSLASNTSKDTNTSGSFNEANNSLQSRNGPAVLPVPEKRCSRQNSTNQEVRNVFKANSAIPYSTASPSIQSTSDGDRVHSKSNKDESPMRSNNFSRIENKNETKFPRPNLSRRTYVSIKNMIVKTPESKTNQVTSLPNRESPTIHEKSQVNIRHSFNESSPIKEEVRKYKKSSTKTTVGNNDKSLPLPNSINSVTVDYDSGSEEISAMERLDRLTNSCNLLELVNINDGYQNVSQNGHAISDKELHDCDNDDEHFNLSNTSMTNKEKVESISNGRPPIPKSNDLIGKSVVKLTEESRIKASHINEIFPIQSIPSNKKLQAKLSDNVKHIYKLRVNENQPAFVHSYREKYTPEPSKEEDRLHVNDRLSNNNRPTVVERPMISDRTSVNERVPTNDKTFNNNRPPVSERQSINDRSIINDRGITGRPPVSSRPPINDRSSFNDVPLVNDRPTATDRKSINERIIVNDKPSVYIRHEVQDQTNENRFDGKQNKHQFVSVQSNVHRANIQNMNHSPRSQNIQNSYSNNTNQNVRCYNSATSSTSSSHSTEYSYNQNKYSISKNIIRRTTPISSSRPHMKTPIPMPRLNVSYSKVHDAIEDNNDVSASTENIYAEISDR